MITFQKLQTSKHTSEKTYSCVKAITSQFHRSRFNNHCILISFKQAALLTRAQIQLSDCEKCREKKISQSCKTQLRKLDNYFCVLQLFTRINSYCSFGFAGLSIGTQPAHGYDTSACFLPCHSAAPKWQQLETRTKPSERMGLSYSRRQHCTGSTRVKQENKTIGNLSVSVSSSFNTTFCVYRRQR